MRLPRASGVLLHPTSLPGRFGVGDLGPTADVFIDFLAGSGQRWWQVLPVGPTGYGNSPYQSLSSFAGNPLLISPERLVDDGLLSARDLKAYSNAPEGPVDYDRATQAKEGLLRAAFARFEPRDRGFAAFRRQTATWLNDYALFRALKSAHGERAWTDWAPALARRDPAALERARRELREEVRFHEFVQYVFARQWNQLRALARANGLGLIGDVPIFVAHDSADVWSRPDLFELDEAGRPLRVAGVPPDYFSKTGQLWGNPLYRWDRLAAEGHAWWAERLQATLDRVDLMRLDHFRGFEAYYAVPAGAKDARVGEWLPGPGAEFFHAMQRALGGLPLIAEDLGYITPEVHALRDQFGLPGMRILQFSFGKGSEGDRPFCYPNHCVVYPGTHDNETTVGWFRARMPTRTTRARAIEAERAFVLEYLGTDGKEIAWDFIRLALSSVADTVILPMQDVLSLGDEARMNTPGQAGGNWAWRLSNDQLSRRDARDRLGRLTAIYGRWNSNQGARPRRHPA